MLSLMIRIFLVIVLFFIADLQLFAQGSSINQTDFESTLIKAYGSLSYPDSALTILNGVKPHLENDSLIAEYLRIKGSAFFYKGIIDSAIASFSASMAMIDSVECNAQYAKVANGLAVVLQAAGMRKNAIDHYSKALGCAEYRNDQGLKLKIFSNLSILNNELQDFQSSQFYIDKALEIIQKDDQRFLSTLYNTKAQNFIGQNLLDSALHYSELSLSLRSKADRKGQALNLNNLGYICALKDDGIRAREFYERAVKIREEIGDLFGIASIFINMADLAISEEELSQANQYL